MADNPRIEELQRRVQKDPASIAFAQLAEEYRRAGEHHEAVRVCRTGLAKHPSYLSARVTLGRALVELEQYDEAHTELEYVLRSAPENLAAIRGLAEIHQRRGELGEALKQYQTALGIAKHDPELEESVQELTRQLGGATHVRPEVRAFAKPNVSSDVRVSNSLANSHSSETAVPPAIPIADLAITHAQPSASPLDVPPLPLNTFEEAPDPTAIPLSPELEAAADEFTRALEALDAITIDVPTPALGTEPFELPPIPLSEDDRLVPAEDWEHGNALANPAAAALPAGTEAGNPDAAAIADLQNWLDNIVLDRGASKR